jgi:hypothetical protein
MIKKFRYFWNLALLKEVRRKRNDLGKREIDLAKKVKDLSA